MMPAFISLGNITPLQLDLTHQKMMDTLKKWKF